MVVNIYLTNFILKKIDNDNVIIMLSNIPNFLNLCI